MGISTERQATAAVLGKIGPTGQAGVHPLRDPTVNSFDKR